MKTFNILFFVLLIVKTVFGFQNLPGVSKPLGFFDPLGFSKGKTEIEFKKIQESELKHGRIAMLASLGLLVQNYFHPLFGFQDTELGNSIYHYQIVSNKFPLLTPLLLTGISMMEGNNIIRGWQSHGLGKIADLRGDYIVGDLGLNPFEYTDEQFNDMRTKELNNGRLAMIATLLIVLQQLQQTT